MTVRVPEQLDDTAPIGEVPDPRDGADPEAVDPHEADAGAVLASRRPVVAGGLAGAWALLVGVALVTCLVMLTWAVSPNSAGDSAAAWRAAGLTWLGAHLVPLELSGQPVTLLPLGALALGLLLVRRGGSWAIRMLPSPTGAELGGLVAGVALIYGSGGAGVAWLSSGPSVAVAPGVAFACTALVAAAGVLWGVAGEAGLVERMRAGTSDAARRTVAAGLAAVGGMLAAGAGLVAVSLVRHFDDAADALAALEAGFVGSAGLTLVGVLSLPTLVVWGMSVLVGPGFAFGETGGLSAFGGEVQSLPALPVLAAIPTSMPAWAPALMAIPIGLGVLAGRIRWGRDLPTAQGALVAAGGLGLVVAGLVAALVQLTSGALGGGRLAEVGPPLLPIVGSAVGLVLVGFFAEAGSQSLRLAWELHRAEQRAASLRVAGAAVDAGHSRTPPQETGGNDVADDTDGIPVV